MLINDSITNLIEGVSQQPQQLRRDNQAETQINCYSSIVDGLTRRAGTKLVGLLTEGTVPDAFIHTIDRDEVEQYIITITGGNIRATTYEGKDVPVATPDGVKYLYANDVPSEKVFRAVTVADYTFIVNNDVTVKSAPDRSDVRQSEGLIYFRTANYGRTMVLKIDGLVVATLKLPDGTETEDADVVNPDQVARIFLNGAGAGNGTFTGTALNALAGYSIARRGSVLHLYRADGVPFVLSIEDGDGGTSARTFGRETQRFSDLPASHVPHGYHLEITGDNSSSFDNYYVKYDATEGSSGVWKETVAQDVELGFDAATMPHVLIREVDGTFTFRQADWAERAVGDDDSSPFASFLDNKIEDIYFVRNRLGFIANESTILSRVGRFFDFWRTTITDVLDDDPIDVSATGNSISILKRALVFDEDVLLFADRMQFTLTGGELLTPATAALTQNTAHIANLDARPVTSGTSAFFAVPQGSFSGVREIFAEQRDGRTPTAEVTSHVPQYLEGQIRIMASAPNENLLVVGTDEVEHSLYVYKYFWSGDQKVQSSWSRWGFGNGSRVVSAVFRKSDLVIVIERDGNTYIEVMDTSLSEETDLADGYRISLDRLWSRQLGENATVRGQKRTYFTAPYPVADLEEVTNESLTDLVAFVEAGQQAAGRTFPCYVDGENNRFYILGHREDTSFSFGVRFTSRYTFSTIYPRQRIGTSVVALTTGRLQLRSVTLSFNESADFELIKQHDGRPPATLTVHPHVVGSPLNLSDKTILLSGERTLRVRGRNTKTFLSIRSDSVYPFAISSLSWEGQYVNRSRRV